MTDNAPQWVCTRCGRDEIDAALEPTGSNKGEFQNACQRCCDLTKALEATPENVRAVGAVIDAAWSKWCGGRTGLDGADHMASALLAHFRAALSAAE